MIAPRILLALALIVPLSAILFTPTDSMTPGFFADEAVYFGMIQSLAYDADLIWTRDDLARICETHPAGPVGIILKKRPDGVITYAKPPAYALAAAPFYRLFGSRGIVILNILLAWIIMKRLAAFWGHTVKATIASIGFLTLSAWSPYTLWYHPEIFTSFLLVGHLVFWFDHRNTSQGKWISAVCFGLAVTIKPPLIILGLPAAADLIRHRHWKPLFPFIITVIAILLLSLALTGNVNPYEGNRRIFIDRFPLDTAADVFGEGDGWSMDNAGFYFDPTVFLWNTWFFLTGRFTGVLWYFFPCVAIAILAMFRPRNTEGRFLLASIFLLLLIQLVLIPGNYHGGGGAIGNRYFANICPLLFFTLPKLPQRRTVLSLLAVAGCFSGPFLIHPWFSSREPGEFARHGLYSRLPAEWTLCGAFPIFHPSLYRASLPGLDGHLYFLDRSTDGLHDGSFNVLGKRRCLFMMEMDRPVESIRFVIRADAAGARGIVTSAHSRTPFSIEPDAAAPVTVNLGEAHKKMDFFGVPRWIYPVSIRFDPLDSTGPDAPGSRSQIIVTSAEI